MERIAREQKYGGLSSRHVCRIIFAGHAKLEEKLISSWNGVMELKGPLGLRAIPATITEQAESGRSSRVAWQKFPDNLQHSRRNRGKLRK